MSGKGSVHAQSLIHIRFFVTSWIVACQTPLSMGLSKQEYYSGLPCPPPGESSQPRDWTCISCTAGGFVTIWALGRVDTYPKADYTPHPPTDNGGKSFYSWGWGSLHAETAQSALTVILKLVIGGLISVILIVLGTVNLQFQGLFPFPWGQFLELWQLMSWLQSGHNAVHFFYLVGVSVPAK